MTRILTENPNQIYTLTYFADLFDAAKSTISEDLVIMKETFDYFELGEFVTVTGAAGGVKYWPRPGRKQSLDVVRSLSRKLTEPERVLPGGFIYMSDILADPLTVQSMGELLASRFSKTNPDFVLTREPVYAGSVETGDEAITFCGSNRRNQIAPLAENFYRSLHTEFSSRIQAETGRYVYDSAWAEQFAKGAT